MNFKNLTSLPSGSIQLKFKKDKVEIQPVVKDLKSALMLRNELYLKSGFRPNFLHVAHIDMNVLKEYHRKDLANHSYQVHARKLIDHKYSPRIFSSKVDSTHFAQQHIKAYNAVVAVYNGERERQFLAAIETEVRTLTPAIETGFDATLWTNSAHAVFGQAVPEYFELS